MIFEIILGVVLALLVLILCVGAVVLNLERKNKKQPESDNAIAESPNQR